MVKVFPEGSKYQQESWNAGWHDGYAVRSSIIIAEMDAESYSAGYGAGLDDAVTEGRTTVNVARSLMGLAPYREAAVPAHAEYELPEGEVRTTSSTGGMKGVKAERYSLIPVEAMDMMARLYGFGAEKYEAHNWRKGYEWSKSFDSLFRHATAALRGEDIDPETGLPHLAGAAFHCFTLMVFMQEHPEFDDRWKPESPIS